MSDRPSLSERVRGRIARDFKVADRAQVERTLTALGSASDPVGSSERMQAAVLIISTGRTGELERAAREVVIDWRDVLMAADLGFDDWPARVDAFLGEP